MSKKILQDWMLGGVLGCHAREHVCRKGWSNGGGHQTRAWRQERAGLFGIHLGVQHGGSTGRPAHLVPTPRQNPFLKVACTSLLGSPCKRVSIPPAAWIEQEARSRAVSSSCESDRPTQAPAWAWGPSWNWRSRPGCICRTSAVRASASQSCPTPWALS